MDSQAPQDDDEPTPEERRFVEDLLARGQAAEADAQGNLPQGATHEIVGRRKDGSARVRRRRFSAH